MDYFRETKECWGRKEHEAAGIVDRKFSTSSTHILAIPRSPIDTGRFTLFATTDVLVLKLGELILCDEGASDGEELRGFGRDSVNWRCECRRADEC